ncbi:816_t:CDS:2 [Racocetra fulgida]|uniref:816_t:CDS:1 n=1 Tax=Racocetra fulgida TaxID=60492 RepID=A0A9N8V9T0_9GLOM|nr:816_t:CDS:2 [Racocetra fulgida]
MENWLDKLKPKTLLVETGKLFRNQKYNHNMVDLIRTVGALEYVAKQRTIKYEGGTGKDGGKFLILKTNPDKIFVFDKHVPKKEWGELREGSSYELELKEGKNGNKKLMGFAGAEKETPKKTLSKAKHSAEEIAEAFLSLDPERKFFTKSAKGNFRLQTMLHISQMLYCSKTGKPLFKDQMTAYPPFLKSGLIKKSGDKFNEVDQEYIEKFKKDVSLADKIITWEHYKEFGQHSVFCLGKPCQGYEKITEQTCDNCKEELAKSKQWEEKYSKAKNKMTRKTLREITKLAK